MQHHQLGNIPADGLTAAVSCKYCKLKDQKQLNANFNDRLAGKANYLATNQHFKLQQ